MMRRVFYDHLYENQLLDLQRLDSVYSTRLREKEKISAIPTLYVKNESDEIIASRGDRLPSGNIVTEPVEVGYEYKHTVYAVLPKPPFFHDMFRILTLEAIFLMAVIGSLVWQLRITRNKLQTAKVQAMGIAHLEHELRKPLLVLTSLAHDKMLKDKSDKEGIWKLMHARLAKIADVTQMMLFALKKDTLKIERMPLDIRQELEMTVGIFRALKQYAKIDYQIEEGIDKPILDNVYFGCVLANLIDNGIKYNTRTKPKVHVHFGKDAQNWILRVEDNGIGIPE
ncbi:MAG: HAMP domain-containing histidine kinase, partial [Odoribacter sp.]|nr:HAMP domain-containing histidine kinase [Odoribacter sp.]